MPSQAQEQAQTAPLVPVDTTDATNAPHQAHFVFVPLNEHGHLIPAIDTALLLATHGAVCTTAVPISTAKRLRHIVDAARDSGLPVRLVEFPLDYAASGLPEGADDPGDHRIDPAHMMSYYTAVSLLRDPIERYLRAHAPPFPTCVVSDFFNPWTTELAPSIGVPRLSFFSMCAFSILCQHNLERFHAYDGVHDSNEPVVVPGLDNKKIVVTRAQAPVFLRGIPIPEWEELADYIERARAEADGVIVSTVLEMEPEYVAGYAEARGFKVWTVGPVALYHQGAATLASRGSDTLAIDADECLRWLDGKEPGSVVYVSFGSIAQAGPKQVVEFVTHCGWNSTLEAFTAGLPMVTWPHFTDQFLNEKMVVEVLGIGVSVGVKEPLTYQDVAKEIVVEEAVRSVMGDGEEAEERRRRSSHANLLDLVKRFGVAWAHRRQRDKCSAAWLTAGDRCVLICQRPQREPYRCQPKFDLFEKFGCLAETIKTQVTVPVSSFYPFAKNGK